MQISVEKTSELAKNIKIIIPTTKINDIVSNKIKTLSKQIKLNGFRPGHVPHKLITQKYGPEVRQEALNETIDSALNQAISENKLAIIGDIELKEIKDEENALNIECIFAVEVYPEITINNDFTNLEISVPKVTITDEDIDKNILDIRQQCGQKVAVTRSAKKGDFLTVDFEGFIEGKEFPGGKDQNVLVEIGNEQFIDGFEEGLIGKNAGESCTLNLQFPENYAEKNLAGQKVQFNVVIKKIEQQELAELNEELAKRLNIPNNDINQLRTVIKTNLENYVKQLIINKEQSNLADVLLKNYPISIIPNKLITEEQQNLERIFKQRNKEQGIEIKELNSKTIEEIKEQASKNVHLSLLLREVIRINDLKVNENLLNKKLTEIEYLFRNKQSNSKYKNLYNNMKNSIISSMLTNVAIDFILNKVTKTEQILTLEELNK